MRIFKNQIEANLVVSDIIEIIEGCDGDLASMEDERQILVRKAKAYDSMAEMVKRNTHEVRQ